MTRKKFLAERKLNHPFAESTKWKHPLAELLETEEKRLLLRGKLKLDIDATSESLSNTEEGTDKQISQNDAKAKGRAGHRNPVRDKTGKSNSES